MGIDHQALQRAAIWYVGAFAALGSVLLGGASLTSVDWSHAAHPWIACLLIGMAIVAAFAVVTLASFVMSPGCTVATLRQKEDEIQRQLQQQVGGRAVTWTEIASTDKRVLRALYNAHFKRSPNDLWAAARGGDDAARKELESMVVVANGWLAHRRFRALRYITPVAAAVILAGGITWKSLTAPPTSAGPRSASSQSAVVTPAPGANGVQGRPAAGNRTGGGRAAPRTGPLSAAPEPFTPEGAVRALPRTTRAGLNSGHARYGG